MCKQLCLSGSKVHTPLKCLLLAHKQCFTEWQLEIRVLKVLETGFPTLSSYLRKKYKQEFYVSKNFHSAEGISLVMFFVLAHNIIFFQNEHDCNHFSYKKWLPFHYNGVFVMKFFLKSMNRIVSLGTIFVWNFIYLFLIFYVFF